MLKSEIRNCKDIGLWSIDRSRQASCKWKTSFCRKECYNCKLENVFNLTDKDIRNDAYWNQLTGKQLKDTLSTKKLPTNRIRLMTRGESFADTSDVLKVKDICDKNKDKLVWIPTRAWRDNTLLDQITTDILKLKNSRVQASLDPSNIKNAKDVKLMDKAFDNGFSFMFFGDDQELEKHLTDKINTLPVIKCKKTWNKSNGHCLKCRNACFSNKQTVTWLKQH